MKRVMAYPPRPHLSTQVMKEVVSELFPVHGPAVFDRKRNAEFSTFTESEMQVAQAKMKNGKTPGPVGSLRK